MTQKRLFPSKKTLSEWGIPLFFLCIGLCLTFWRTLISRLDIVPGDLGDARLIHYILEANVKNLSLWKDLWDLSFYYPTSGILAYSDTYLLPTLLYAPIRYIAGFQASYPLWLMVLTIMNFGAMYIVSRKLLKVRLGWAVLASYMFAFPLVQIIQLNHSQSLLRMFVPFGMYALYQFMQRRQLRYLVYFGLCVMLSLYGAVYISIFLVLCGSIALCFWGGYELVVKRREEDTHFLDVSLTKNDIIALFLLVLGVIYIGFHYVRYAPVSEGNEAITFALAPTPLQYLAYPPGSLISSIMPVLGAGMVNNNDVSVAMGAVYAGLLFYAGIRVMQTKRGTELITFTAAVLLYLLTTRYGNFFPWSKLSHVLPGMYVIRATGRVWMVAYPAVIFVLLVTSGKVHMRNMLFIGVISLYIFDNIALSTPTFRMSESERRISRMQLQIPNTCTVAALERADYVMNGQIESLYTHIDAMHATLRSNVKLVGGYTGYRPEHYPTIINESTANALLQEGDVLCVMR